MLTMSHFYLNILTLFSTIFNIQSTEVDEDDTRCINKRGNSQDKKAPISEIDEPFDLLRRVVAFEFDAENFQVVIDDAERVAHFVDDFPGTGLQYLFRV